MPSAEEERRSPVSWESRVAARSSTDGLALSSTTVGPPLTAAVQRRQQQVAGWGQPDAEAELAQQPLGDAAAAQQAQRPLSAAADAQQASWESTAGAQHAAYEWAGFTKYLRAQRAARDHLGIYYQVAFHAFVLLKMWSFLPTNQRVHLAATMEALLLMLVWRWLDFASFARWRDWIQVAIRLLLLLSPPMGTVWELSVGIDPPPALVSSSLPVWAVSLAMLPLILCAMLVPHYHVFATGHSLPLWPHLLLHTLFALCATSRLEEGCSSRFVAHPLTLRSLGQVAKFCNLLSFRGMWGARAEREHSLECRHVTVFLQLFGGFLGSLATAVLWDASTAQECLRQRQRQRQQQQQQASHPRAHVQQRCALPDRVCDALSARFLMPAAVICRRPAFWWLAAVLIWNLVVFFTP